MDNVRHFNQYLIDLNVEFVKLDIDWYKIHEYCLRYSLETTDAAHVLLAIQHSDYLVTIDKALIDSKVTEVEIVDPGNLLTKSELRFS